MITITKKTMLLEGAPLAQTSDGQVKVKSVTDGGQAVTFKWGDTWKIIGKGFVTSEKEWFPELSLIYPTPGGSWIEGTRDIVSDTEMNTVAPTEGKPAPGTYPNAVLCLSMAYNEPGGMHTESLNIPINLVVE